MSATSIFVPRTCSYTKCLKQFMASIHELSRGRAQFCSRQCARRGRFPEPVERFWNFVLVSDKPNACWLWTGAKTKSNGHGVLKVYDKKVLAHRFAYELYNGFIDPHLNVNHCCPGQENPACVRKEHLYQGTQHQNMLDAFANGKRPPTLKGAQHSQTKITNVDVLIMRSRRKAGERYGTIAKDYGMSQSAVRAICVYVTWKHIP